MSNSQLGVAVTRRPEATAFTQQKLPEWRPKIEAGTISPLFVLIAAIMIPVGIGVLYVTEMAKESIIDYTFCDAIDHVKDMKCADIIGNNSDTPCMCNVKFNLDEHLKPPVYMYYSLTNFYQNHRKYVKSRDDFQLLGQLSKTVSSDCRPFDYVVDESGVKKPIAPCGAIANSLFNDTLTLQLSANGTSFTIPVIRKGIAWPSDKNTKFQNPPGNLTKAFEGFAKPINWKKEIWELDTSDPDNNGLQNEDLIVWMRTAALPTFRKLYRIVNHANEPFRNGLPAGKYLLKVNYAFPVTMFGGRKRFIISNTSPFGGYNPFLGYMIIIVGCLTLLGALFLQILHLKYGKRRIET